MKQAFLCLCVLIALWGCQPYMDTPDAAVRDVLEQVSQQLAPDKRVVWWHIDARQSGRTVTLIGETSHSQAVPQLVQRLQNAGYQVRDSIRMLPDESVNGHLYGVVNLSVCNIRSQPKHSAELSTQALLGTPLRLYQRKGDWWLVQTPDDYFGWLDADGFTPMTRTDFAQWQQMPKAISVADFGFVWTAPHLQAERVSDLVAGDLLAWQGERNGWAQVTFPDGRQGFIPPHTWMPFDQWLSTRQPTPERILATARQLMGRPYLWGGTSGKGVDCSGFTKMVFFLNGLVLARDASQQVHTGLPVATDTANWEGLQPADLLFFGRPATDTLPERIWHVAIHTGQGRIIHAAGRVREESLNTHDPDFNAERLRTFVRARRIIGAQAAQGVFRIADMPLYTGQNWKD